ncbi:olfactory receptor 1-like [Lithobates pipiens]
MPISDPYHYNHLSFPINNLSCLQKKRPMENYTSSSEFHLLFFPFVSGKRLLLFIVFSLLYLTGVLMNCTIIIVIYYSQHLHSPLYIFLCNLSTIDILYTTVNVPKLLDMLLFDHNTVSFNQCFTQLYFYGGCASTEDILLFTMAYDRYVAICKPLHYHYVFSGENCIKIIIAIWVSGYFNSLLFTITASQMSFCESTKVEQFFCDPKALLKIACTGTELFYIVMCIELFVFGICPFSCTVISYMKIIRVILHIKSKEGRWKTLNTCSSHLSVISVFYGTVLSMYMMPQASHLVGLEQALSVLFTTVVPVLNPLIYSLPNREIKRALIKFVNVKKC